MSSSSVASHLLHSDIDSLRLHKPQRKVVHRMLDTRTNHRLLFVAGTGSGKTIASIITAMHMLQQELINGVHITAPKGVIAQFSGEVKRLVPSALQSLFRLQTHQTYFFEASALIAKNKLLIVDEAHQLSTLIERDKTGKIKNGMMAHAAIEKAQHAKSLLLLTATPMENNPTELLNLLCMVSGKDYKTFYKDTAEFRKIMMNQSKDYVRTGYKSLLKQTNEQLIMYAQLIAPYILFAKNSKEGYPRKKELVVRLTMDKEYLQIYNSVERNELHTFNNRLRSKTKNNKLLFDPEAEDAFYINLRRVVNGYTESVHSKKIDHALHLIEQADAKQQRILAYSNFLEGGITLMRNELQRRHVPFVEYTGKSSAKHRDYCMKEMNGGRCNVLLLSRAGAEGLDLKCIRHVILLEPHFHNERLRQVIGRAVRYKSHDSLPTKDREVTVHHLLLCKPVEKHKLSWEENHHHNFEVIQKMVHKYKPVVATSKIILHTNTMNALLIRDVLSMMKEPDDLFQLECDIDETDFNIYVKITGGLAFLCLNEHEYDDIVSVLPPTTNISVDDILYKIALRKQYVIQQHLALLQKQQRSIHLYSSSAITSTSVQKRKKRKKTASRRKTVCSTRRRAHK